MQTNNAQYIVMNLQIQIVKDDVNNVSQRNEHEPKMQRKMIKILPTTSIFIVNLGVTFV